jgi:hypothetical protein
MASAAARPRAEGAPALAPAPGVGGAPEREPTAPDPPVGREAAAKAQTMIDAAIETGHWTEANFRELRQLTQVMNPDDRDAVARKIAVAINQARLRPDDIRHLY